MKSRIAIIIFVSVLVNIFLIKDISAWPNGISGRTKKSNNNGCVPCHASGTINSASFSGPDTVYKGQTVIYTLTINKLSSGNGGCDIAAFNGLLDTLFSNPYLEILNSELVHINPIPISGSIALSFKYIAPNYVGTDTLYATIDVGYPGSWRWAPNKVIRIKEPIGITGSGEIIRYELQQNFPNPFNPATTINYSLNKNTIVNLDVYNSCGNLVTSLVNGYQKEGNYKITFDAANYNLSSGIYFYSLRTENSFEVKRMVLIK